MTAVVFCGPSIDRATVLKFLPDADCRPPAVQGDVYAALLERPAVIAIIDGVFLDVASVWHREILAALEDGIAVWGAASMGALRAAECANFGMVGIGKVFEAYQSGRYAPYDQPFEDDDEVAILHGPPEIGARPISDAMVDLRETLARAEAGGAIDKETRDRVAKRLKSLYFADRSFERLVAFASEGLDTPARAARARRLERHRCSQKREDALSLLDALSRAPVSAPEIAWRRERTIDWVRLVESSPSRVPNAVEQSVLAALKRDPALERRVARRAAARVIALTTFEKACDPTATLDDFRYDRSLLLRSTLSEWTAANGLDAEGFGGLLADEAALAALADRLGTARLMHAILDELRLGGDFERLAGIGGEIPCD